MKRVSFIGVFCLLLSCTPAGLEQSIEQTFVATPRELSVPDSSRYDDIRARVVAYIGGTTAYSFVKIDTVKTDSLFVIAVWGRYKEKTGDVVQTKDVTLDSTILFVLNPVRYGKYYFKLYAQDPQIYLSDSTIVY